MDQKILSFILPDSNTEQQREFVEHCSLFEKIPGLFYGILQLDDQQSEFLYLSKSIEAITGYPAENFSGTDGLRLFYAITPAEYNGDILERQINYRRQCCEPGFDFIKPYLLEINAALINRNGQKMKVRCLLVTLRYTKELGPLWVLVTYQRTDGLRIEELDRYRVLIENSLTEIQQFYIKVCPLPDNTDKIVDLPIKLITPVKHNPKITDKELEILKLIAEGYSSKEISSKLKISFHTAETHRKHLMDKFSARNAAELIKKATKVYWLE